MSIITYPDNVVNKQQKIISINSFLFSNLTTDTISVISSYINDEELEFLIYLVFKNQEKSEASLINFIIPFIKNDFMKQYNFLYEIWNMDLNKIFHSFYINNQINYYYQPINDYDYAMYLTFISYSNEIKLKDEIVNENYKKILNDLFKDITIE
jgi:vacuolar-type H+-ATPase catalytic subunit A/Vma1